MTVRGSLVFLSTAVTLAAATCARANEAARRYEIPAGTLEITLSRIAHDADISLLFDRGRIKDLKAPAVRVTGTPDQAFSAALSGSGLSVQRLAAGEYVLPIPRETQRAPDVFAVPEVLVIGSRSQNSDIQRRQDDIEPYQVFTSADIGQARVATVDELLRSRLTLNDVSLSPRQLPGSYVGSAQSLVNLRGLGTDQTLILIDGRRMASLPDSSGFQQTDISGIPLSAIERIETYGGTAGAIYGSGATAGVVNIVLRQNFPEVWAEGEGGITTRSDNRQIQLSAGLSHVSRDGRTQVSVMASYTQDAGLRMGDRSFVKRANLARLATLDPTQVFVSQNLNISSQNLRPLTLIPSLGGQSLGSLVTNMPTNAGGAAGNEAALLLAGAGGFDTRLSMDGLGSLRTLLTPTKTYSLVTNLHQDLGSHFEIFSNVIFARNEGHATVPAAGNTIFSIAAGQLGNPFTNPIQVAVSTPGFVAYASAPATNARATVGLIARLPKHWSFEADFGAGYSKQVERGPLILANFKAVDVFSPGSAFADVVAAKTAVKGYTTIESDRLTDVNFKLAGPLFPLPNGPVALTVSGEYRDDHMPNLKEDPGGTIDTAHSQSVGSGLLELRAPIISPTSDLWPLRGLEVQLAGRADRTSMRLPVYRWDSTSGQDLSYRADTLAVTAGLKVTPVSGLTLRASIATGHVPPQPSDILALTGETSGLADPKRPDDCCSDVKILYGGSPNVKPERATTTSLGVILQPLTMPGLRISADYTRIAKAREISTAHDFDTDYILANESRYPSRVSRLPLAAEDAAKGYTRGVITEIDTGSLNVGRSTFQAIDLGIQYSHRIGTSTLGSHLNATWTPSWRDRPDPASDVTELAGTSDGPLTWRGTAGVSWRIRDFEASVDIQYLGSYHTTATPTPSAGPQIGAGTSIPSQTYIDLGVTYRMISPTGRSIRYDLAVKDVFDRLPPLYLPALEAGFTPGYSTFGDPRGRRLVFTVRGEF